VPGHLGLSLQASEILQGQTQRLFDQPTHFQNPVCELVVDQRAIDCIGRRSPIDPGRLALLRCFEGLVGKTELVGDAREHQVQHGQNVQFPQRKTVENSVNEQKRPSCAELGEQRNDPDKGDAEDS
jgi:hypothetical protein